MTLRSCKRAERIVRNCPPAARTAVFRRPASNSGRPSEFRTGLRRPAPNDSSTKQCAPRLSLRPSGSTHWRGSQSKATHRDPSNASGPSTGSESTPNDARSKRSRAPCRDVGRLPAGRVRSRQVECFKVVGKFWTGRCDGRSKRFDSLLPMNPDSAFVHDPEPTPKRLVLKEW